jgi:2OG-Fe(II) oxygenase superfamily
MIALATPVRYLVLDAGLEQALSPPTMESLVDGELLAIVVRAFTAADCCSLISDRLIHDHRLGGYATDDGAASIKKIGMPLFEVAGRDPVNREQYYATALRTIRDLRALSHPAVYPMDHLRLALQELWPEGAGFEELHPGRKMFVGMPRVFEASSSALPHVDRLAWDVPDIASAWTMVAQIAVNVHLRTATRGGEIELWSMMPDRDEYEQLRQEGSYGLDRTKLPPPDATVTPSVGDLILFNSNRVHAVRTCGGGPRVTVSCFVGYRGVSEPLTYWS